MDPGNFATNIQAGAKYGYGLLWVVLLANVIAMLFQGLSAKLGIVTGTQPRRTVPRSLSAPGGLGDVGGQRDRRHGDRSRRVPRRRHRTVVAVSHAALRRNGRDRDHHLRPLDVREIRLSAARTDHRLDRRRDLPLLFRRDVHRSGRLGFRCIPYRHAANRRRRGAVACRRHHRRHRDAARDLSAFRPDAGAGAGSRRRRSADGAAVLQQGSRDRALSRRISSTWPW